MKTLSLTPDQKKLFDQYLKEYGSPMTFLYSKRKGLLRQIWEICGDLEELEQLSWIVLVKTCQKWDESYNVKFSTYFHSRIRAATHEIIHRSKALKRTIPEGKELVSGYSLASEDNKRILFDKLTSRSLESPVNLEAKMAVKRALNRLPSRTREMVKARYGLGTTEKPKTLSQLGKKYGITKERVRQIVKGAQVKMKRILADRLKVNIKEILQ